MKIKKERDFSFDEQEGQDINENKMIIMVWKSKMARIKLTIK